MSRKMVGPLSANKFDCIDLLTIEGALLTRREIAQRLGVTERRVTAWATEGLIHAARVVEQDEGCGWHGSHKVNLYGVTEKGQALYERALAVLDYGPGRRSA